MAKVELVGIVGKDPEIKFFQDFSITKFSVAETPRTLKDGQWQDGETIWWNVSVAGKEAESAVDNFKKGDKVLVQGEYKSSTYISKTDGLQKTSVEIRAKRIAIIPKTSKNPVKKSAPIEEEFGW
jgi:single-strand DNA-binding protein